MNSFTGSGSQRAPSPSSSPSISFDSYKFDFGIGSGGSSSARPLKDQKLNPNAASSNPLFSSSSNSAAVPPSTSRNTSPAAKPSWTHQPVAAARSGLPNPSPSMVGDIHGRSWSSANPAAHFSSHVGIPDKNPNLFGDLVGSAIGQGRAAQNVPLKSAPPKNSSFSMAGFKSSLPPANSPTPNPKGGFSSIQSNSVNGGPAIGSSIKPAVGSSSNSNTDPFGSLTGFGSKPSQNVPLSSVKAAANGTGIGSQKLHQSYGGNDYSFEAFQKPIKNDFAIPNTSSPPQPQPQRPEFATGADSLNMFFFPSSSSTTPGGTLSESQQIPEMNDWDIGTEFGGHENGGTTTELEGLPPPPAGVTASSAKTKGLDNYKQGQFADAIKWLSWAFVLFEKSGQAASSNEVLVCRSSCYKEVGEYKKAIADCSKVLDHDRTNVSVLLQRALLYESSEKYRLGAEDLRAVLKIDPGNRLARSTIHRMNQFAE
ncbi:hypothetical protein KSP39_PZI006834 [Platanthera zijinensis]|uniref:Uncharacterized protein n=1 Tax=Platanthera zijinensis TaxID=2320716 RepID=A0AAP0G9J2_9ASPA